MCFTSIGKLAFLYRVEKLGKGWDDFKLFSKKIASDETCDYKSMK